MEHRFPSCGNIEASDCDAYRVRREQPGFGRFAKLKSWAAKPDERLKRSSLGWLGTQCQIWVAESAILSSISASSAASVARYNIDQLPAAIELVESAPGSS